MLRHLCKVFLRSSLKNASYSLINISGLVIGLTAFIMLSLYVLNETSYDQFHAKKDRVFRVRHDRYNNGELDRQWVGGPMGIGSDLKDNFAEVKRFVRLNKGVSGHVLANGNVFFKEDKVFYASEDFFKIFSYSLIEGVDSLALRDPFTMVVSESLAKRYFGNENPIGKTLKCNNKEEYIITGVFRDVPVNTHLKFDALFSFESLFKILGPEETHELLSNWGWEGTYTYIELDPTADAEEFQAKLPAFVEKKMGTTLREWNEWMAFTLQPISSIHLNSDAPDEVEANGSSETTNFLIVVAVFILLMAWINYINLATAKSMERAKEVGIRKVLGTRRSQLIAQFLFESAAIMLIALAISVAAVGLLLPTFSNLVGRSIEWSIVPTTTLWLWTALIFGFGVITSGLYPAVMMSGFIPASVLKGRMQTSFRGIFLRRGLVTIQFISSVILIVGTFTVYQQLQFMRKTPSGIQMEQTLVIKGPTAIDSTYKSRFKTLLESLQQYPDVAEITVSTDVPGQHVSNSSGNVRLVGQDVNLGNMFQAIMTDEHFITAYGLTLLQGKNFSGNLSEQWKICIVNETAMKLLGVTDPEKVLGEKINLWGDTPEIVGVVKDYHQESLKQDVKPLVLVYDTEVTDFYSIKIKSARPMQEIVALANMKYSAAFPGNPFQYFFLDDHYGEQYQADKQFGEVMGLFTVLAIFIACLGLFGLSSYLVLQRTKEIGIRKILGATINQIMMLVSREFILTILVANVIAWPIAYYFIEDWLTGFAFRINIGVLTFLLPGMCILFVAILTVATQSFKAASTDPVKNLRTD